MHPPADVDTDLGVNIRCRFHFSDAMLPGRDIGIFAFAKGLIKGHPMFGILGGGHLDDGELIAWTVGGLP